jgi:uncharacterized membrane protein YdjX (TVP38/TMEM64 family)
MVSFLSRHRRLLLTLAFFALLYLIARATGVLGYFNPEEVKRTLREQWYWSFPTFIFMFCVGNLLQIPGIFFLLPAVLVMGALPATALTLVAANIACLTSFLAVRSVGKDSVRRLQQRWVQWLLRRVDSHPVAVIFVLRLAFQSAPPVNYTLAMANVRLRDYALATLLGLPLPTILLAHFYQVIF